MEASSERDFDKVFQAAVSQQDGALIVAPDALFLTQRVQIADLAARYQVATMFELREYVEAGGLVSHGASAADLYRQGGNLTGQILMDKKPADLPVLRFRFERLKRLGPITSSITIARFRVFTQPRPIDPKATSTNPSS